MNTNSSNNVTTHSILQDGVGKIGLLIAGLLFSSNFTGIFPYALIIISSLLAGYFLSKMRDDKKTKVVENDKINLFESMVHQSNDIIMLYDAEAKQYEYANLTSEVELGISLKASKQIEHPSFENLTRSEFAAMVEDLENGVQSEFNFDAKSIKTDGKEATFEVVLERIIVDSKNYVKVKMHEVTEVKTQFVEMNQNIDNYEEVIQQYKNSNREMEEYASMMSAHDLQQPIQKIMRDINELESESWFKLDMDEKESVHSIKQNAHNLSSMIQDVIAFSTVGANTTFLEMKPLSPLVEDVINHLEYKIKESDAIVEVAHLPEMVIDSRQVKHIFKNLIENAIDNRGEESPVIMISCTEEESDWRITVSDNCGVMDEDQQEKIFDTFSKLSDEEQDKSNGVNLAICKKIILNHNGTIGIESENDGTTIFFTIPMTTKDQLVHA